MNSFSMPDLMVSITEWLFCHAGGIDQQGVGFKNLLIKPYIGAGLTWAQTTYDSIHGTISVRWEKSGDSLLVNVTIPANATATVYVPVASKPGEDGPAKDAAGVAESGKPAAKAEGVKFLRMEGSAAVYALGSGTYRFQSTLPETIK
jgi:alpha-L-rhamnosidase